MEKWEYLLIPVAPSDKQVQTELNTAGEEGWELVTTYISAAGLSVLVLKRPKIRA